MSEELGLPVHRRRCPQSIRRDTGASAVRAVGRCSCSMTPISSATQSFSTWRPAPARWRDWRQGGSDRAAALSAADISRPMLDVAKSKPSLPNAAPITYIESPAAPLAVESALFDAVVCQQGLQFFPDRLAALGEMRRALKPRGAPGDCRVVPYRGQRHLCGPPRGAARQRSRRSGRPSPGAIQLA